MISLNNEPCCVCGQTKSLLVQETTYPEHRYPGSFALRKCESCGLLFNSPRLDDHELSQLYGRSYYFFNRPDASELKRIPAMYARSVALVADEFNGREKRTLDVGCGRGYFPAVLKQLEWQAHGVEISKDAADYARTRFAHETIFNGTIEQYVASSKAKQFPLVTAIDVIEHVPSPTSFVKALSDAIEPGGLLIIDTPNAAAYNIKVQGAAWKGFNPFHIFLFTIPNLRQLLSSHGLTVEQSFSYGNVPADRAPMPLSRRLKLATIASARSLGVIGPLARAYFKVQSMMPSRGELDDHVSRAVEACRSLPPYLKTRDAEEPLAPEATGDNIVIIARKR